MNGQPAGHLLSVVKLIGDGAPIRAGGGVRVLGMSLVDKLKGNGIIFREYREGCHCI